MNVLRNFGTVTLLGKEYPVKFGINQSAIYCELQKCDLKKYNEVLANFTNQEVSGSQLRDLVYSILKDGARAAKQDFQEAPEDIADLIDGILRDEPEKFGEIFTIMIPKELGVADPNETPATAKVTA